MPHPSPHWAHSAPLRHRLWTDRALTWEQVVFGGDLPQALHDVLLTNPASCGVHVARHDLGLTRNASSRPTVFVCRDARTARYHPKTLRQLAGTAALRQRLRAPWSAWTVQAHHGGRYDAETRSFRRVPTPDAVWRHEEVVWIEYDAGSHTRRMLAEKLRDYAVAPQRGGPPRVQVWGAATEARVWTIHQVAVQTLPAAAAGRIRVMVVDWRPQVQPQSGLGHRLR